MAVFTPVVAWPRIIMSCTEIKPFANESFDLRHVINALIAVIKSRLQTVQPLQHRYVFVAIERTNFFPADLSVCNKQDFLNSIRAKLVLL